MHFSSYQIFFDTQAGVTESDVLWDRNDDPLMTDPEAFYTTITGLDTAMIYYFVCRAADSAGNGGAFSNEVLVSTLGASPRAPSGLVIHKQGNHAVFTWNSVTEDTLGQPTIVEGYRIYVHPNPDFIIDPEYFLDETADTSYVVPNVFSLPSNNFFAVTAVGDNTPVVSGTPVRLGTEQ